MPSFHPDDFVAGGLIDDVDVEIVQARFCAWDYNGTLPAPTELALRMDLKTCDGEEEIDPTYLSAGKIGDWVPTIEDNGATLSSPTGKRTAMVQSSNFCLFINDFVTAAKADHIDCSVLKGGSIACLDGVKFHLIRKPAEVRQGLAPAERRSGQPQTRVSCNKVLSVPWQAAKGRAKPKPAAQPPAAPLPGVVPGAAPAAAAAPPADDETDLRAAGLVIDILMANPDGVAISSLKQHAWPRLKEANANDRNAIINKISAQSWLENHNFTVAGGIVAAG